MSPSENQNWGAVWLDHFKAVLALPKGDDCEISTIYSGVPSKHRSTGGKAKSQPYMHETGPYSAQHFEAQREHRQEDFYAEVSAALDGVTDLLVLGIGLAPKEFTDHFLQDPNHHHVLVTTEKAEEMTDKQFRIRALEHFGYQIPRFWPDQPGQPVHGSNP